MEYFKVSGVGSRKTILGNFIFNEEKGWQKRNPEPHPTVKVVATTDEEDYNFFDLPVPKIKPTVVEGVTDLGAQSDLMGLRIFRSLGLKEKDLIPVKYKLRAVNGKGIDLLGAIFLNLTGRDKKSGKRVDTRAMVYVTESTDTFYLSR